MAAVVAEPIKIEKPKTLKKNQCINRVKEMIENYKNLIIFNCDHVASNQFKKIRSLALDHGEIIMGKNTLFKKGIQSKLDKYSKMDRLLPQLVGNVGLFFTNNNLRDMRDMLESISEQAPVKPNMISQCDVTVPKGPTGLSPDKTSFFQALNISTMIVKSVLEIVSDIPLLKKGQKVGASEATLMQMLNIRPFSYKINTKFIYDSGLCYPPEALDVKSEDILKCFESCVNDIACVSLSISYPTKVSVSHVIQNTFNELLAICLAADISNSVVDEVKESLANASSVAATAVVTQEVKTEKPVETKAEEPEEEDDVGLFDFFE